MLDEKEKALAMGAIQALYNMGHVMLGCENESRFVMTVSCLGILQVHTDLAETTNPATGNLHAVEEIIDRFQEMTQIIASDIRANIDARRNNPKKTETSMPVKEVTNHVDGGIILPITKGH